MFKKLKTLYSFLFFFSLLSFSLLLPSHAHAANSGIFTVSLWVKPTSSIASQALLGKAEELRVFTDASGYAGCQIKSTTWQTASTGTQGLALSAWNHVACAYDKATLKIYVNGVLANSNTLTATIDDTANALLLGQDSSASTPYSNLTGDTDDFKFYNYARTQKQVIEDMGGGHPGVLAGSSGPSSVIASGARQSGPVAYYKFDEGYGTTAHNSGSQGETLQGTLTNMATAPSTSTSGWTQSGKFNRALNFDGTDDYVVTSGSSYIPSGNSAFTISLWVNPSSNVTNKYIIKWGNMNTNNANIIAFGGSYIWHSFYANDLYSATNTVPVGSWTQVIVTFNGTTRTIYINGTLSTQDTPASVNVTANQPVYFGSGGDRFPGKIDEVKIYPYALTADEVKLDYNKGSSQVLGALSDTNSLNTSQPNSAASEYCVPGDTTSTSCAAPVGRWDFEENTGSTVNDKSGNGNTGTWNGTLGNQWKPGKSSPAGNFNGSDNYVDLTNTVQFDSGGFTIEGWLKTSQDSTGLNKGVWMSYNSGWYDIEINMNGNKLLFYVRDTAGTTMNSGNGLLSTNNLNNGMWHHFVATRSTSIFSLYIDGSLNNSATTVMGDVDNAGVIPRIGNGTQGCCNNRFFNGQLDQFRIFNYARTPAQIAWDYNRGAPVGHWKMDECQGDTVHDSSGNGNHGTINLSTTGTQTTALGMGTCSVSASTPWYNGRTGKFNSSLAFDGTNDYVSLSDPSSGILDFGTGDFTVGLWVNFDDLTNNENGFIHKDNYSGTTTYNGWLFNIANAAGGVGIETRNISSGSGPDTNARLATANFSTGTWYHILATRQSNVLYLYVNGVQRATATESSATNVSNSENIRFGSLSATSPQWFTGKIDDVRIYNYALTGTQVKLLYNQNSGIRFGPSTGAP